MSCKHNTDTLLSPYKADVDNVDSLFTHPANTEQHQLSHEALMSTGPIFILLSALFCSPSTPEGKFRLFGC